jgi:hypothetical protein
MTETVNHEEPPGRKYPEPGENDGRLASYLRLRAEFLPHRISPTGIHLSDADCSRAWDAQEDDARNGNGLFVTGDLESQIERCAVWLGRRKRLKAVKPNPTSGGIKHSIEHETVDGVYVCNGAVIMGAWRLGLMIEQYGSRNARFNIGAPLW